MPNMISITHGRSCGSVRSRSSLVSLLSFYCLSTRGASLTRNTLSSLYEGKKGVKMEKGGEVRQRRIRRGKGRGKRERAEGSGVEGRDEATEEL